MIAREIHGRRFVARENTHGRSGADTVFEYFVDARDGIHGSYAGGEIRAGRLLGRIVAEDRIEMLFQSITVGGELLSGRSRGVVSREGDGRVRLDFEWEWLSGDTGGGTSSYVEAPAGHSAQAPGAVARQRIGHVALLVRDYDEAIAFYTERLGFEPVEDTPLEGVKRWVLVAPPGGGGTSLLLARAVGPEQESRAGDQTGGRVFLFLHTDDFWREYHAMRSRGVRFTEEPRREAYGTVAVFEDLYGNRWDLVEPKRSGEAGPGGPPQAPAPPRG